ncbi:MAG: chromosome segregation SMC family protein [Patescibacteria group bacterium]|jgi:chromosome segregation protein
MHLERLEIQGFKSFANKNVLVFPDPKGGRKGITSVVGPNGSGKSNIADAVRWALGEQSMKILRGKKSEDVIFSGSDKKGKLGMAEVSLFLNNEDGKSVIDYSQIVLTRRLFRDGESDYLLNGQKARLLDIQMFLAKAKFGQRTYSVIGQGTVEGFLNTSLSERKEFFDEATGVKQFQIKRDDSLNKLRASYENLSQARMLLEEIAPRLKTLTRQVDKLKKRDEMEKELREAELKYYGQIWQEINGKWSDYNKRFLELEKVKKEKDKKLEALNREHSNLEVKERENNDVENYKKELAELQTEKEKTVRELARLEARAQIKLEAKGKFDLSWVLGKIEEIKQGLEKLEEEKKGLVSDEKKVNQIKIELEAEAGRVNSEIKDLRERVKEINQAAGEGAEKKIVKKISALLEKITAAEESEDFGKIKKLVSEIKKELEKIVALEENEEVNNLANIEEEIEKKIKTKEDILEKFNKISLELEMKKEKLKMLCQREEAARPELKSLEEKIKASQKEEEKNYGKEEPMHKSRLEALNDKIAAAKEKIEANSRVEEEERRRLFKIQRSIQDLQNELNSLSGQLGEVRVASTRYETRLEDLEKEIRQSSVELKEVRQKSGNGTSGGEKIDAEAGQERIASLKRQLELIGGLDPEIEKEYTQTKVRHDFLADQVNDLNQAITSLEKIVRELDGTIKERFDKEFKIISSKFEEYFKILFNGGAAKIVKVMESEMEEGSGIEAAADLEPAAQDSIALPDGNIGDGKREKKEKKKNSAIGELAFDINKIKFLQKHNATGLAGIEIQATPPGKKIRSISMLSGGERALTAIALICAIISANPSPFVVLDEVDAALDEANSERLAKILDDLSHKTQFIVITHNRATMRRANILYGVTMQQDGASKLLSVKLEEAVASGAK